MTTILQRKDSSQSAQVNFSELVSPLLQRIYSSRNACCDVDVDYQLKNIEQPYSLKGFASLYLATASN